MEKTSDKNDNQLISNELVKRDKNGRVLPGSAGINPAGRPPDKIVINEKAILDSLHTVEEAKKKPFLIHLWERAFKNDSIAKAMLDKFVANKGVPLDQFGNAGQFNVTIQYFGKKDKDTEDTKTIDI